jgi:hypothetical protein
MPTKGMLTATPPAVARNPRRSIFAAILPVLESRVGRTGPIFGEALGSVNESCVLGFCLSALVCSFTVGILKQCSWFASAFADGRRDLPAAGG